MGGGGLSTISTSSTCSTKYLGDLLESPLLITIGGFALFNAPRSKYLTLPGTQESAKADATTSLAPTSQIQFRGQRKEVADAGVRLAILRSPSSHKLPKCRRLDITLRPKLLNPF